MQGLCKGGVEQNKARPGVDIMRFLDVSQCHAPTFSEMSTHARDIRYVERSDYRLLHDAYYSVVYKSLCDILSLLSLTLS